MGVAEGGVGDEQALLRDGPGGEFLRTELKQKLAGAGSGRQAQIADGSEGRDEGLGGAVTLGVGVAVDGDVAEEGEELGGAVLTNLEAEEVRRGVNERGGGGPGLENRMGDDVLEERDVGLHPADAKFAQHAAHTLEGDLVGLAAGDDLHEHGVVERRDDRTGKTRRPVEADPEAAGRAVGLDTAVIGHEFVGGVLGRDAALEGEAVARHIALGGHADLGRVEGVALGDEELGTHEIEAGDDLGDRMFNLDTRVHLDEEPLVPVEVVEEFDGAGVVVTDLAGDAHGGVAELGDDVGRQAETGGDLDDLLVAALDGAIALVEVDDVAVAVAEDLHLDMFRARDVFFEEDGGVAEGAVGLALGLVEQVGEVGGLVDDAHTATAAAEGRLDDEGEADGLGDLHGLGAIRDGVLGAGQDGDGDLLREGAGGGFVAHHVEQLGARADKDDAGLFAGAGEGGVFGEETVAGVDGVNAVVLGDTDDALDVEVGGDGALAAADLVGLVGLVTVNGETVLLREDGDGAQAELGAGAEDAHGDLGAVGGHQAGDGPDRGRGFGCFGRRNGLGGRDGSFGGGHAERLRCRGCGGRTKTDLGEFGAGGEFFQRRTVRFISARMKATRTCL